MDALVCGPCWYLPGRQMGQSLPSMKPMRSGMGRPLASNVTADAYMLCGSKLRIVDFRNFGFSPSSFRCPAFSAPLPVAVQ